MLEYLTSIQLISCNYHTPKYHRNKTEHFAIIAHEIPQKIILQYLSIATISEYHRTVYQIIT